MLYRLNLFVRGLAAQCDRHGLDTELILVEWNPPEDRPPLAEALDWPNSDLCRIRVIEVPASLHAQVQHSDRIPLFQMIGKNVGIRRSRGRFVLATNVDLLFSDEIMMFIAAQKLERDVVYRVDRYDVTADIPADAAIDEQLRLCSERVVRIHALDSTRDLRTGRSYKVFPLPWWMTLAIKGSLAPTGWRIAKPNFADVEGRLSRTASLRAAFAWERSRLRLHTNASGDFTLIDADGWRRLRGYPELEAFSMHLDGLLLYQAHYAGLREQDLPHRIYHLEHSSGFKPDDEGLTALNERLERESIPQLSYPQFKRWAIEMKMRRAALEFNDENWGLAQERLPEFEPSARRA